jgi:hypothetical protein
MKKAGIAKVPETVDEWLAAWRALYRRTMPAKRE